jgi:hypothetical protein
LAQMDSLSSIHVTLDLPLCISAFQLYLDPNELTPQEITETLGISARKLRAVREWLILMGFLRTEKGRTVPAPDADLLLAISEVDPDSFLELAYYRLCTRNQLMAGLVNVFLADQLVYSVMPVFKRPDAQAWFLEFFRESRSENDLRECFNRFFSPLLRSDGFGPLGLLLASPSDRFIMLQHHVPHPLVFAFILAEMAAGRPSVPLDEVVDGFNSPGRLFFLGRQKVLEILIGLERDGLLQLDLTANLNQVGLGGQMSGRALLSQLGGVIG